MGLLETLFALTILLFGIEGIYTLSTKGLNATAEGKRLLNEYLSKEKVFADELCATQTTIGLMNETQFFLTCRLDEDETRFKVILASESDDVT